MILALSGLILILGVLSCTSNEIPAATSAGFVNSEDSGTPAQTPATASPAAAFTITKSATATEPPSAASTSTLLTPHTSTPQPSKTLTPLACWQAAGQIETRQLESEYLPKALEYLVYLPPCYAEQAEQRYPVIYLIHGQTYRSDHWLNLGAAETADRLIAAGELSPFIMVFPYDRNHYISPPENGFAQALSADLIPAVDEEFRTNSHPEFRAIGGISRGGNWAVHIGLQQPDLFGAIGAHSTPVFSVDTNPEIIEWLKAIPLPQIPRLFIDAGKNDRWLKYTLIFEQLLNEQNTPHEWHLYAGFHDDIYWQTHLEEYLRWYAHEW